MIANPLENAVSNECTERRKNPRRKSTNCSIAPKGQRIMLRRLSHASRGKLNYFHEISNVFFYNKLFIYSCRESVHKASK